MPRQLHLLYGTISSHSEPQNPLDLWLNHKEHLIEEYARMCPIDEAERRTQSELQTILFQSGISL